MNGGRRSERRGLEMGTFTNGEDMSIRRLVCVRWKLACGTSMWLSGTEYVIGELH